MLAADDPSIAHRLLLLSYPLHPLRNPLQLRTGHFPNIRAACTFVHGVKDPFGSVEEMREAVKLIPASVDLMIIQSAGHELKPVVNKPAIVAERFVSQLPSVGAST
jgi:predicted alpha/beta-hydrolase family hydrolase